MNAMIAGLITIGCFVILGAGIGLVAHAFTRPRDSDQPPASHALRELEPRGGRQRFTIRLFESGLLIACWIVVVALVALWAPIAARLTKLGNASMGVVLTTSLLATWWAWRRGVLRDSSTQTKRSFLPPRRRQMP